MKIRVLQLAKFDRSYKGGIEKVVYKIHDLLDSKYSVFTICLGNKNEFKKKVINSKINFNINSFFFSFSYLIKSLKLKNKVDLIIGHMPNPLCISLLLKPRKYILFWHSDLIGKNFIINFFYKPIEFLIIIFAKRIIFTSQNYHDSSFIKFFKKPYSVIPLSTQIVSDIKKSRKISKRLLSVGRLVNYKNYIFLIKAMMFLPSLNLTIIGDGPEYYKLINFIEKNKINNVSIRRNQNDLDLKNAFLSHDILCLASNTRAEAFGVVLLEALSYGLPILVGNNKGSGMLSICRNGYNGNIFNYEISDFKAKANLIFKNYSSYSNNALRSFYENYTDNSFIDKISSEIIFAK